MTELPESPASAPGLRALLRRVVAGVLAHRRLAATVVLAAMLEAFFTKAPLLLIPAVFKSFTPATAVTVVEPPPGPPAGGTQWVPGSGLSQEFKGWFHERIQELGVGCTEALGIEFAGDEEVRRRKSVIFACSVLASLLGIAGGFAIYLAMVSSRYFATRIVVDLRNEVARHILRLPLRFFGGTRVGDLISNLTNDAAVLSRSFMLVADHTVADPMLILGNLVLLLLWAPEALFVMVPAVPVMALPMIRMGHRVRSRSNKSLAAMGDATESMNQMLTGFKTVKAYQLERERMREFEESNERYLRRTKGMLQAKGRSQGFVFVSYQIAFAAMLLVLGWLLINGDYALEDIVMVITAVGTTYTPVKRLCRVYNTMMESLGALDRIEAVLHQNPDRGARGGRVADRIRGDVAVENVSFGYGDEPVLRDVSFRAAPGTMVALVGPSGAGKSTCVDLIARFHDPRHGRITIDGQDLRELDLASYRRHVAMVDQSPFLFNASILDNIRCGRPDATREEVEAAARAANIHDFIVTLPQGYDTIAGERGSNLSGGQRQRITIARAILRNPAILLLDEATSALDSESEEAVQKALAGLMKGRTSIVIAHRLATVRDADWIVVMRDGRVVEQGRHADLVDGDGLYRRLIELQDVQ